MPPLAPPLSRGGGRTNAKTEALEPWSTSELAKGAVRRPTWPNFQNFQVAALPPTERGKLVALVESFDLGGAKKIVIREHILCRGSRFEVWSNTEQEQ